MYPPGLPSELHKSNESIEKGQLDNKEQEQRIKVNLASNLKIKDSDFIHSAHK